MVFIPMKNIGYTFGMRSTSTPSNAPSSDTRPLSSNTSSLTSKEFIMGRIKENFDLETQSCLAKDCNTSSDAEVNRGNSTQLQYQLRRLRRRCAKLERKLQEKEADIQAMQEQQQLRFPLLVHETMRSLRSLDSSKSEQIANPSVLSHSVISSIAQDRIDTDARIHEYEQQIAELYEENQQEKLKNEMLSECLRDQKHAKAKLMKACKHVKQELQAMKDSGLSQMLVDIEARCDALEKEKAQITKELLTERALRAEQESQQKITSNQLDDLVLESTRWEDIVTRKNEQLQQSRDQICEQQLTIENLKADLKGVEQTFSRPRELCREDEQEEMEQLKSTLSIQRTKIEEVQRELQRQKTENDFLRHRLASQHGERQYLDDNSSCASTETYDKVLIQVRFIKKRLCALRALVQTYEETNTLDINLLSEEELFRKNFPDNDTVAARSCKEYAMQLSGGILEAARYVSELQQVVEDASARLLGSTCALQ
ncbi:hypothetical protein F441_06651 [Phytophthora nicotianae CJ01A1]|uniref:Uncharacterized protein n=4 Tax=Phytophthora nicotianae TaxID=4792 RepID=V9FFD0_PHYNI|nr:hypothetical protein F443_06643 [Phytophthora nicotianae P1569]ETK89430.1 hypothetical protein L915_06517 [Phytophthora nicotianae]ETP19243.1 hypothetical protein F441_06651 [Phytophthora nicotianae CJ01A1]ETP47189.1 hypothetical protein F442_06684 [Phytophthora nicotianae P10297]ETL42837.1 hypothetical protein L916_06459 [Phytophthora nicotianae]